jgi:hypothetical protein
MRKSLSELGFAPFLYHSEASMASFRQHGNSLFSNVSEAQRDTLGDLIERYVVKVTPTTNRALEDTI